MGCNSSTLSDYAVEQEDISSLLKKPQNELTEEEKEKVLNYLSRYEPIVIRLDKILTDINKRLNGEDDIPEYTPSLEDMAMGRLKSTMKSLKSKIIKFEGESQHYLQLAKENKNNEAIYKMHLKYVAQCRKSAEVISNRLGSLEDKLMEIQTAGHTLNTLLLMNDVADNLESMQKVIGSADSYDAIFARVNELDENLTEMNIVLGEGLDDTQVDSYMEELDAMLDQEAKEELQLPDVPTIQHEVQETVKEAKEERIAVAVLEEFCVCFFFLSFPSF